tara:strand:- start:916 stop:1851 length:936 start_codon:yes stop_codon:yes gene_type:complete
MIKKVDIVVDAQYDPTFQPVISGRTRLAQNVTMAKFLGGYGDPQTINHLNKDDKLLLAKQYYLHAQILQLINSSPGLRGVAGFEKFRLVVSESYYRQSDEEDLDVTDGINYLMTNGRAVVYELIGEDGKIAIDKTFDLAVYLKNNINYDKLILNYDTYNPDGTLHVDLILIMPEIISPWRVSYQTIIETRFNNSVQSTGELMEIGGEEEQAAAPTGSEPLDESKPFAVFGTGASGFGTGFKGYFYPIYIDKEKVGEAFHVHTFVEYPGITFYMPNSSKNHAKPDYNRNLYTLYPSPDADTSGGSSAGVGEY